MYSEKHNKNNCDSIIENPDCETCKQQCFKVKGKFSDFIDEEIGYIESAELNYGASDYY